MFSEALPTVVLLPKRLHASEIGKFTQIYTISFADVNEYVNQKNKKFHTRLPKKTMRGDNWSVVIMSRLPV